MANLPKISSGHSVSVAPSNPDSPNPHPETKLNPPFSSPLGHTFPPPPIHSNQIPSPSIMIPSPNVVTHPYQMPSPSVRTPSPNSVTQPNQIRSPSVRTPSPNSVVQPNQMSSPSVRTPSPSSVSPSNGIRDGRPVPHLSTPPAAPRFSSPIQTPVVPYRTSHPSPRSLAFSSGSNLPMSSPPQCSNGSIELQHQVSDASEDLFPVTESTNVLFSANKVLKQKKLVNTPSLGFGALVSPGREISLGPQIIQRDPHRCQNCGAYANFYCNILIGSGQWQCVICRNLNGSEGEYIASSKEELRTLPELSSPFVDYIQTGDKRPGFVPVSDYGVSAPVVLVIDECLDEPHLQHLQSSLHAFVDSLPPTTRIGIVLYGRTVSVYDFSEESTASADVLPGKISPSRESLKSLIYGTGLYISPLHASRSAAHSIFSSLRSYKLKSPETSRDRCLGTAVEVALAIIKGPSSQLPRGVMRRSGGISRIIVCAGGPNTHGPGSVPHSLSHPNYPYMEKAALKWMENLGHEAHRHNTVVDILCAGTCPVRVPIVQSLAKACGGVLILHDDFGEAFGVNLQRASTRAAGSHGLLEVRCSDNISVTQVIGPGEEGNADNHEYFKNDSSLSIQMLSVEEMQCFALSMETRSDIKSEYVYFQFAIQYSNIYHADVSRVITVRLPTVDSVSAYLETIQDEVAAVIIAKRTLLRAKDSSTANDMRATIDERIKDIASKFGSHTPRSKLYRFPKELAYVPEFLFHLRRGPLLGNIVGHEDERSVLRSLFLNASLDLSIRMVAPRCLMHREGGTFEEVPAHDLAMQSDSAVVLDHGTDIFIWLGAELASQSGQSAAALAACRTLAEELTEMRFPAPRILAFKEGSSQARYFVSRLIPAHKDPPYEQEARFPQLRTLSPEQRTKLKSSFIHFDEPSFCEWMRGLKVSPPEPS